MMDVFPNSCQSAFDGQPPDSGHRTSKEKLAYSKIKDKLFSGEMHPGQKIIYRDMEIDLGMSKTPIIGALARLAQEGMVTIEHNRGYFVRKLDKQEVKQLYSLRIRMEEIAVDYAIKAIQSDGLGELRLALDEYVAYACSKYDSRRLKLDTEFHLAIARLGGNSFLEPLLKQLYDQVLVAFPAVFMTALIPKFVQDHIQIYEALESLNATRAKTIIRKHEQRALKLLQEYS